MLRLLRRRAGSSIPQLLGAPYASVQASPSQRCTGCAVVGTRSSRRSTHRLTHPVRHAAVRPARPGQTAVPGDRLLRAGRCRTQGSTRRIRSQSARPVRCPVRCHRVQRDGAGVGVRCAGGSRSGAGVNTAILRSGARPSTAWARSHCPRPADTCSSRRSRAQVRTHTAASGWRGRARRRPERVRSGWVARRARPRTWPSRLNRGGSSLMPCLPGTSTTATTWSSRTQPIHKHLPDWPGRAGVSRSCDVGAGG